MNDIDLVFEELRKIEEQDGILKPESVVEFAKNKKTALHEHFDWNDSSAGHKYRLWQARQLIRVKVAILHNDDEDVITPAWVHFEPDEENDGGYRYIVKVLSDEHLTEQMLESALRELRIFQKKYKDLKEIVQLSPVFDAIEEAVR